MCLWSVDSAYALLQFRLQMRVVVWKVQGFPHEHTIATIRLLWRERTGFYSCAVAQVTSSDSELLTHSILIPLFLPLFPPFFHCTCRADSETVFEDDRHDKTRPNLLWQWKSSVPVKLLALVPGGQNKLKNQRFTIPFVWYTAFVPP